MKLRVVDGRPLAVRLRAVGRRSWLADSAETDLLELFWLSGHERLDQPEPPPRCRLVILGVENPHNQYDEQNPIQHGDHGTAVRLGTKTPLRAESNATGGGVKTAQRRGRSA